MICKSNNSCDHEPVMALFYEEVDIHTAIIKDITDASHQEKSTDAIMQMIESALVIKSGAGIVDVPPVHALASSMEHFLLHWKKRKEFPDISQIAMIRESANLICQIAETACVKTAENMAALEKKASALVKRMNAELEKAAFLNYGTVLITSENAGSENEPFPVGLSNDKEVDSVRKSTQDRLELLSLFQTELIIHLRALDENLPDLEMRWHDADLIDTLIRSAHSIKGAADIADLSYVVDLAHEMEDVLLEIRHGNIIPQAEHIDTLLKGSDLLAYISETESQKLVRHIRQSADDLKKTTQAIKCMAGKGKEGKSQHPPHQDNTVDLHDGFDSVSNDRDLSQAPRKRKNNSTKTFRVGAESIERLMGRASEIFVGINWLNPYLKSIFQLKADADRIVAAMEKNSAEKLQSDRRFSEDEYMIQAARRLRKNITDRLNKLDLFIAEFRIKSERLYQNVSSIKMQPLSEGIYGFSRLIRDMGKQLNKKVRLSISGASTPVDRDVLEKLDAPLTHLLRNAVVHGIEFPHERKKKGKPETGLIRLEAMHRAGVLVIGVRDDGCGIDKNRLQKWSDSHVNNTPSIVDSNSNRQLLDILFYPGFSTTTRVTRWSGRGFGLNVVKSTVEDIGGTVWVDSVPDRFTQFMLKLPLTLSVVRMLLVDIAGETYAFPLNRINRCLTVSQKNIYTIKTSPYINIDKQNIALVRLCDVLELDSDHTPKDLIPIVVVSQGTDEYGLIVDAFIDECDLVVRPLDPRLEKIEETNAMAVTLNGMPVLVFDIHGLIRSVDRFFNASKYAVKKSADRSTSDQTI